ncbi:MAG: Lrp/AsnC family transcriptional regulator [Pseudomonadota bacterium]
MRIDRFDARILGLLQSDASVTTTSLADRIGLSQSPCWRRIKRLEDGGLIKKRVTLLERRALGLDVVVFVQVKLHSHSRQKLPEFEKSISRHPEVVECHTLLGEMDYLLKVVVRDIAAYEAFFRNYLSQAAGVEVTRSLVVVSEVKSTTELPIETVELLEE